jgi:hypothetical protein
MMSSEVKSNNDVLSDFGENGRNQQSVLSEKKTAEIPAPLQIDTNSNRVHHGFGTTKGSVGSGSVAFDNVSNPKLIQKDGELGILGVGLRGNKSMEELNTENRLEMKPSELQYLTEYRSMKTACHELCHVFGMTHCPYFECLMNGSNLLNEADAKPFLLCPICLRKLDAYFSLQEGVPLRYRKMLASI